MSALECASKSRARLWGFRIGLVIVAIALGGCVVVPQNRRRYLADPTMQTVDEPLEQRARDKLHTAREAAAGGNGQPAGGGCGCSN
jgi:hypothetical protein